MKFGIQLFGSMKIFNEDPEGFLRFLADQGYSEIEPCVSFGPDPTPFAWPIGELDKYAKLVKSLGLTMHSCHIFSRGLPADAAAYREVMDQTGVKVFVAGFRGPYTKEGADPFIRECLGISDMLEPLGGEFWLHNNAREIAAQIGPVSAYEYILASCEGRVGAQIDTGWAIFGGKEIRSFLEANKRYIRSIHHKDLASLEPGEHGIPTNTYLGGGVTDTAAAVRFALGSGLGQIVDLDNSAGSLKDDIALSAGYLRGFR